jgi:AraC-like DNA-binding protein
MKEIKDVSSSVLVLIVTAHGDEEVAVEALRNGCGDNQKKPRRKNILPGLDTQALLGTPPSAVTPSQYHKIQQAACFINDNYRTNICLDAVAVEAGMSPSHFSRMFKKVMGLSYQEYLNSCRVTKAKDLLRTSALSVTEIAISLGFSDPTGFGRIFRKLTGQTPSSYRNLARRQFFFKKA